MLAHEAVSAPLLDRTRLDLEGAERITYRLEQAFRYDYDEPVRSVRQRLVVVPPRRHGDVHLRHHTFDVSGAPADHEVAQEQDSTVVRVRAEQVEDHIEFRLRAVLERVVSDGAPPLPAVALRDPRLLGTTRLTEPDEHLRTWAEELRVRGEQPGETAQRLCAAVHGALTYQAGATTERTSAAQALAGGRGVCQDFAHVLLVLCRLLGLPARYVSGHLIGQGGTHAWVEVIVPAAGAARAVALDACNGRRAGAGHVTVATGRDYADVAPTTGTYVGAPTGRLTSTRVLGVVGISG